MSDDFYTGPVCYQDGWHYTVVDDPDARERALAVAQAHVDHTTRTGSPDDVAAAEAELADVQQRRFEKPGDRLHLEDSPDGSESRYRLATDADTRSWHDRKHGRYAQIAFADGTPGMTVTADEMQAIQAFLEQRRSGDQ